MTGNTTRLVTNRQLREQLNLSNTKLYRLRRDGDLPYVEIAGRVYYDLAEVEAFLDSRRKRGIDQ